MGQDVRRCHGGHRRVVRTALRCPLQQLGQSDVAPEDLSVCLYVCICVCVDCVCACVCVPLRVLMCSVVSFVPV